MNGFLYFVLREYASTTDPRLSSWDLRQNMELCESNFFRYVEMYETMVTPTLENLQCLLLAV